MIVLVLQKLMFLGTELYNFSLLIIPPLITVYPSLTNFRFESSDHLLTFPETVLFKSVNISIAHEKVYILSLFSMLFLTRYGTACFTTLS
jgi:phage-related protein